MKDIAKRIKALFFLRAIFLISLVVGIGSLLVEGIAMSFGEDHVFSEAGSMTVYILAIIFGVLRVLVVILSAVTLIFVRNINKECRAALFTTLASAVIGIVGLVLQYFGATKTAGIAIGLVSGIGFAAATFLLIDGIFDRQARKEPLFHFAVLGIVLMVVSSVLSFLSYIIKNPDGLLGAVYGGSQLLVIIYSIIIFMSLNACLKEAKNIKESEAIQ